MYDFEVRWGAQDSRIFSLDSSQTIGEIIGLIVQRLHLPEVDERSRISYGLYRKIHDEYEKITDTRTLAAARIQPGDEIFLANIAAPWWNAAALTPRKGVTDPLPKRPLPPISKQEPPATAHTCRLHLAANCTVVVQGDHLFLNRDYLSSHLPADVVARENIKIFSGFDSRLTHVSRKQHCEIFRQGEQWIVRAYQPTYIYGRTLDRGQSAVLQPPGTTLVLGQGGWEIRVELATL
jgi:hypothetical protein